MGTSSYYEFYNKDNKPFMYEQHDILYNLEEVMFVIPR